MQHQSARGRIALADGSTDDDLVEAIGMAGIARRSFNEPDEVYPSDDGSRTEVIGQAGDYLEISPGHLAWVLGDEPCVTIDW
jgi:hypothetical protein